MEFEDLRKAWQSQDAKVTVRSEALLEDVRRKQRELSATVFWRDLREIGVAFFLAAFFFWFGARQHNWTDLLVGLGCLFVGTFMAFDRRLQRSKRPELNDSLRGCVESSLRQVDHQIWLLENVGWWYLLPIGAPLLGSACLAAYRLHRFGVSAMLGQLVYGVIVVLLFSIIYWLNQHAVRKHLQPARRDLKALLENLSENSESRMNIHSTRNE